MLTVRGPVCIEICGRIISDLGFGVSVQVMQPDLTVPVAGRMVSNRLTVGREACAVVVCCMGGQLTPFTGFQINHVKEGSELAKKLKLPRKIREIIEQHHGTSLVRYFFQKAKEEYDPEMQKIGEESYRYPGPKPKSKEAALIMLADAIEAASRSLTSHTEATFKKVITDIFNKTLEDGQLDDCDYSLKELRAVATSFLSSLETIYQRRVEYPGFDFEMKQKKKAGKNKNADDTHNKSTKAILDKQKKI